MNKRKWLPWLLALVLLGLAACSSSLPKDYKAKADANPFLVETGYKKPEINLDGVLDDSKWENLKEFSFGDEINATVKAFYGESGVYVGAVVNDPELWATSALVYDNTSFEVYLDYSGKGGKQPENEHLQIFMDINEQSLSRRGSSGKWHEDSLIKNYAVKVNGEVGIWDENNNYCVEMFIPYSQLGGEPQVDYGIAFGLVGCRSNVREIWRGAPGVNVQSPDTYLKLYRDTNSVEYFRKVNQSNLELDGKDTDSAWAGKLVYAFADGGRGTVKNHFDEKGCYFFIEMRDDVVSVDGNSVFLNDSVEIYIDTLSNGGKKPDTDDVQIRVDAAGNIEVLRGVGDGEWNNVMNNVFAGTCETQDGYAVEVFVPWADLNYEFAPQSMKVSFGSVDWDGKFNADGSRLISWSGIGTDPQVPDHYIKMTAEGIEGAVEPAPDPEVNLDGEFSEANWKNTPSFTYHKDSVKVQWFWTARGCYMAFTVTDNYVKTNGAKPFENSSIEVYLDANKNGGKPDDHDRTILVDAAGNMLFRKGIGGKYIDFGTNRIQSGVKKTSTGYNVELYLPWVEFGISKPEKMGIALGQVTLTAGQKGTQWHDDGLCTDPQNPDLYSDFTQTYIGEFLGDPVEKPEIMLDGRINEEHWDGTAVHRFNSNSVSVNWFWTDKGCYFGFTVADNRVYTGGDKPFQNSSIEIYMDYDCNGGNPDAKDRTILVDAAGNMLFRKGENGAYADFRTPNILSGARKTDTGYCIEVFVPWAEFGGKRPADLISVAFGQVTVNKDGTTAWHHDDLCPDPQDPDWYSFFSDKAIA